MTTLQAPPRVQQPLAITAAQDCELSDAARKLLTPQLKAGSFLAQLARDNLWTDALRFAPYALERRSALWWATLCLWQLYRPTPAPEFDSCFQVVIAWLNEPTEENRRAAFAAGHAAKATTPAGNLALATFFESGSISLPGRPEVPAKPQFMPQALGAAITLAIHQSPRELQTARQTDFVRLALEVMADRWPISATATELA